MREKTVFDERTKRQPDSKHAANKHSQDTNLHLPCRPPPGFSRLIVVMEVGSIPKKGNTATSRRRKKNRPTEIAASATSTLGLSNCFPIYLCLVMVDALLFSCIEKEGNGK